MSYDSPDPRDESLEITIKGGRLVMSIGVDTLVNAYHGMFCPPYDESRDEVKITDVNVFAKEVLGALQAEEEDGSNPVHRLLDNAMIHAIEQGCDGVEFAEATLSEED